GGSSEPHRLGTTSVGRPVLVEVDERAGERLGLQVYVGICDRIACGAVADLEVDGFPVGAVDEVVTIGAAGREAGRGAGSKDLFAGVGDESDFALEHPDELVLARMPVAL